MSKNENELANIIIPIKNESIKNAEKNTQKTKRNDFYVYAHCKADTDEIFYIGKGCDDRAYEQDNRNNHWHSVVNKHGLKIEILHNELNETFALELEANYIACYGRHDLNEGPLVNMTDGWEGVGGYKHTEDAKEKNRIAHTGKNNSMYGIHRYGKDAPMYEKQHTKKAKIQTSRSLGFNGCWLIHKDGRKVFVENQHEFAKEYKVDQCHLNKVINGKRRSHKGWTTYTKQ